MGSDVLFSYIAGIADLVYFFFSSRRRHTRYWRDWSSEVCSSDLRARAGRGGDDPSRAGPGHRPAALPLGARPPAGVHRRRGANRAVRRAADASVGDRRARDLPRARGRDRRELRAPRLTGDERGEALDALVDRRLVDEAERE